MVVMARVMASVDAVAQVRWNHFHCLKFCQRLESTPLRLDARFSGLVYESYVVYDVYEYDSSVSESGPGWLLEPATALPTAGALQLVEPAAAPPTAGALFFAA